MDQLQVRLKLHVIVSHGMELLTLQVATYTYTSSNASGCPNVATLHLTINNSTTTSETQTACGSYTWNGTAYTTSGDYTFTSTNASGCPNVATLHLTINSNLISSQPVNPTICSLIRMLLLQLALEYQEPQVLLLTSGIHKRLLHLHYGHR